MKMLFVIIIGCFATTLHAEETNQNDCTENLFGISDWSQITSSTLSCLNGNDEFSSGISVLCDSSKSQLTVQYLQYLRYQKNYQDALVELQAKPNPTESARNKVARTKMDWETLGNRARMSVVVNKVKRIFSICGGDNQ